VSIMSKGLMKSKNGEGRSGGNGDVRGGRRRNGGWILRGGRMLFGILLLPR